MWLLVLAFALATGDVGLAEATTQMALRTGLPCAKCHVNPTGGGMLTPYAYEHMKEITRYRDVFGLDRATGGQAETRSSELPSGSGESGTNVLEADPRTPSASTPD